jgi:hypothetical protein
MGQADCIWTMINVARFQVLVAAGMTMTVFWNVVQCSLVEIDHHPDDGGHKHL